MRHYPLNSVKIERIVGIQLSSLFPDICHKLIMPDYGICIIGSVLAEQGYEVEIFIEHIEPPSMEAISASDLVLMSTFSAAARRTYELADRIRNELNIPVVMGGTHATYFVEDCLNHCDFVVLREGDETIVELTRALSTGSPLSEVAGIAYRHNGQIVRTQDRPGPERFETIQNYGLIRGFRRFKWHDMLRRSRIPLLTVQSSRGCPFHCRFCIVDTMFDRYRVRDIESLIADLRQKRPFGRELLFVDNYFGADVPYTKHLLKRIIQEGFGFDIIVLCRIDVARDPKLLESMRLAGVTAVYVGIESIQPETLKGFAKRQTVKGIQSALSAFHDHGFRVSGSFVIGADTDTPATIEATVRFAMENRIEVCYFFPLWGHYVERKLGNRPIIPRYRSLFKGWDYCDGNFVSHFPLYMRPSELQQAVIDAHRTVYSPFAFWDAFRRKDWTAVKEKAINLYGWSFIEKGLRQYIPWLQQVEEGFYGSEGRLLEDRLRHHVQETSPSWTFPDTGTHRFSRGGAPASACESAPPSVVAEPFRCTFSRN
jgi:anaerobic magnesium-protoporphyrin IX monomethyl ester cyclase